MVRNMLQDRFRLRSHRETREAPIYVLTVAKPGKIKLSADQSPPPPSTGPFDPSKSPARGTALSFIAYAGGTLSATMTMVATAVPISNLVNMLQGQTGRIVVDETGLNGLFDFNLKFAPEGAPSAATAAQGDSSTATDPQGPSLFTALREDLGLKLDATKGLVEVLVVDSVQRPTEN